ncbi:MAG TPA: hypothetical protein PK887_00745 [Ignavibacteriales bacterium]|nr:hypothetical protein [Ignavibacteriales bacterium]
MSDRQKKLFLIIALIIIAIIAYYKFSDDKKQVLINDSFSQRVLLKDGDYYFDTLSFKKWIERNFEPNTVLLKCYQRNTKNIKYAVINYKYSNDTNYIFAVVAQPKELKIKINLDDLVGYYSSFGNLDSTKKGTAFFYLLLVANYGNEYKILWKELIPIHNGFDIVYLENWPVKNKDYIVVQFFDAISQGTRRFNYFLINSLFNKPHLLETYSGIDNLRRLANINDDEYPDYYEFYFLNNNNMIKMGDSVGFIWDGKVYYNVKNPKQTREY